MNSEIYFGHYVGTVVDNDDPDSLGRVRVKVEGFYGDEVEDDTSIIPWARIAVFGVGQAQGAAQVPKVGSDVVVVFEQGRPENPIVLAGLLTTLDVRNTAEETYTAGPKTDRVEGDHRQLAAGQRTIEALRNLTLDAAGKIIRNARQVTDTISGLRSITAAREESNVTGSSTRTWRGVSQWKWLTDFGATVTGTFKLALLREAVIDLIGVPGIGGLKITTFNSDIDAKATTPGTIHIAVTPPVDDPTHLTDLATIAIDAVGNVSILSAVGFVRIGRVSTGGLLGQPLATAAHGHIGNLGIPIAPTIAVPPFITSSLISE